MPRQYKRTSMESRFWARVQKTDTCWLTPVAKRSNGYGTICLPGGQSSIGAHCYSWELASGSPAPDGMFVCHTCDVKNCVRNDDPGIYTVDGIEYLRFGHLFLAPPKANAMDAIQKDRWQKVRGETHYKSILTEDIVRDIRLRHANGGVSQRKMATEYGVHVMTVNDIIHRRNWAHIE